MASLHMSPAMPFDPDGIHLAGLQRASRRRGNFLRGSETMIDRDERGLDLVPPADGDVSADPVAVPEDVVAEQDAAERQLREEFRVRPEVEDAAEEILVERDTDVRAAREALRDRQAGR
jgi:hypothetical protein